MEKTRILSLNTILRRIKNLSAIEFIIIIFASISCGLLMRLMIPSLPIAAERMSVYPLKIIQTGRANPPSNGCDIEIVEIKVNNSKIALQDHAGDSWEYTGGSLINRTCEENILTLSLDSRLNNIEILFLASPSSGIVKILPDDPKQWINLYSPDRELRLQKFTFFPHPQPNFLQFRDAYPSYLEILTAQKHLLIAYASHAIIPSLVCFLFILLTIGVWPHFRRDGKYPWQNLFLAALIVDVLSLAFITGLALGMSQTGGGRYQLYSIPDAVSRFDYGLGGYLFYEDVQAASTRQATIQPDIEIIRHVSDVDRTKINYYDADDKGSGDFALFSFLVFGWNIASLYYGWFALFILSNLIFIVTYFDRARRLYALLLLDLSVYAILYLIRWANNLDSIHDPRIFGICALAGIFQILFVILDRKKPTLRVGLGCFFQALVIAFCMHVRSSESWQVMSVVSFALLFVLIPAKRDASTPPRNLWDKFGRLVNLWPAVLLLLTIGGLFIYQHYAYQAYTTKQIQRHIFWHNFLMSFAFQPELREEYALQPTDMGVVDFANRYLREKGSDEKVHWHSPQRYEEVVQEITFRIVRRHPQQILSLFFIQKPLIFAQMTLYAIGAANTIVASDALGPYISYPNYLGVNMLHLKFDPFRPEVLAVMLMGLCGLLVKRENFSWENLLIVGWLFLWSILPGWLIYPIMHIVIIPILLLGLLALAVCAWLISTAAGKMIHSSKIRI